MFTASFFLAIPLTWSEFTSCAVKPGPLQVDIATDQQCSEHSGPARYLGADCPCCIGDIAPTHKPHCGQWLADAYRATGTGLPRPRGCAGRGRPCSQRADALGLRRMPNTAQMIIGRKICRPRSRFVRFSTTWAMRRSKTFRASDPSGSFDEILEES
jgi:hypothetical protein